jgi:pimeloyl-ACP methyl ester carboxylesterase
MGKLGALLSSRNAGMRHPTRRWLRWLAWVTLAVCLGAAAYDRYGPSKELASPRKVRRLAAELRDLAKAERQRVRSTTGPTQRQAAALASDAEYILEQYKPLDLKTKLDPKTREAIQKAHLRITRAASLSRLGADRLPEGPGAIMRAFVSEVDGTIQPYSLTIPKAYDPSVGWPLIVSLHGHGWYKPFQGHPTTDYEGAFGLGPAGRGATDFRELGEVGVMRCIAEVKRDFSIDDDRVYIRGGSMGGTGAWYLAAHYADQFAGILPVCGNADNEAWTLRWGWNKRFPGRFDDIRHWLQESHTARAFAPNLLNLPAYVIHGSGDVIVPPEHSRNIVAILRALGAPVEYREVPNKGHGGLPGGMVEEGLGWLCAQPRIPFPKRVLWRADRMRHGKAYWLRLDEKYREGGFAEIEAQAEENNRATIRTANLRAFSVQRTAPLFAANRPLFLTIDGERVILPSRRPDAPEWSQLRRTPELGWRDAAQMPETEPPRRKTAWLEGPISEALLQPFVLVQGTISEDPAIQQLWQLEADRFREEWKRRNLAPCLRVKDGELTDGVAIQRNLLLFGGPAHNSVAARLAPRLPIDDLLAPLRGRSLLRPDSGLRATRLDAEDVGFFLVYPNPEHPDRLVVLWQANGPAAIYQGWGRFGNWFNWGVYDSKKYFDFAVYDAISASPETLLLLGWFGTDWSVREGVRRIGVEFLRQSMAPQRFPPYADVPPTGDVLFLADLRPKHIDQMRGAVGFGRTFQGEPLPEGIGLRAPATLEYALDGTFRRFSARVALRNSPENDLCLPRVTGEKVRFIVKGDDRELAAVTVSWREPELPIEADLTRVRKLVLETRPDGGPSWLHAGAVWMQPQLSRLDGAKAP